MNKHPRLLKEAADPLTPPSRLAALARHKVKEVARLATRNASLPAEAWRERLLAGDPEAWDNPQAAVELLGWSGEHSPSKGARIAAVSLIHEPERCGPEGRFWLDMILRRWWQDENKADDMMGWLDGMSWRFGVDEKGIEARREVVGLATQFVRDLPILSKESERLLDSMDAWVRGELVETDDLLHQAVTHAENAGHLAKWAHERSVASAIEKIAFAVRGMASHLRSAASYVAYAEAYKADPSGGVEWEARKKEHLSRMAEKIRERWQEPWMP